jgi:hypothetical protein
MKYQIEGEVAPHVESTEPTEGEIFQATLDWFNTHPFADMPSMSDLSEIHGAESQVPKWKEMRGDKPGERYQGVYVPFANVTARPTVEGEKQKRGQFYYDTVPIEDGANRLNIVMVGDKPMVMPPTQGDMSNAEYRDITRMYDRFNKEYLHTYKKPARRKSGTSEVFHVYGAGLPYASDKSAWYEQYPSMNPDQQQDGGYIELELTDQEIEQYRKGGYIVEELPKAQKGIINLSGPRASKAEYLDIEDDVKEFADRYVTSEHHRNLLEKQGYPEDKIYWRMQDVLNYEPSLHTRFKTHGNSYVGAAGEGDIPLSLDSGQEAGMPVVSYNVLNPHPFPLDQVVSHEWGHIPVSTGFNPLTENERKEFINRLKPGVAKNEHDLEPQENRSDQFTQKHLDEYRKKTGAPNRMFKLYEDKDIIWLMNNIAATDFETNLDKAKYGGSLPKAQRGRTSGINYGSKAMELGADMLVASDPVQAKQYVIENLGYDPGDSTLIGNILHSAKRPASQPTIEEQLNLPPVDRGETLQGVAQQYIGGPDLKTVSTQAMIKQQQDAQKKEAVAQHYHAERLKDNPNYTIEEARESVDIGGFAWEDYYNRERLWEHGPHTIRGISQAEWDERHGPQSFGSKVMDVVYNPFTAAGYFVRGQEMPDYLQRSIDEGTYGEYRGGSYMADARNPFDIATDFTPVGALHSADRVLQRATNDIDGDFWTLQTGLDAANVFAVASMFDDLARLANAKIMTAGRPSNQQMTNYLVRNKVISGDPDLMAAGFNPLQNIFRTDIKLKRINDEGVAAGLTPQQIAQKQMNEVGITTAQREAYTPLVSDLLYYGINPRGTGFGVPGKVAAMPFNWASAGLKKFIGKPAYSPAGLGARDDAWSLFLGKPQRAGTFSMAETVPTPGIYKPGSLQGMEKFSINALQQNPNALATDLLWNWAKNRGNKGIYPHQGTPFFAGESSIYPTDQFADVMGGYNLRRTGPNTLEYNDIWDLAVPGVPESIANRFLGKKFLSTGQAQFDDLGQTLHTIAAKEGYKGTENLGDFIPKTTGTGVDTPKSIFAEVSGPQASMEDWINKKGPKLFEGLKGKLKRKPKTGAPETPQSGTYEEIAVKDIIENATAGVPKTREHYFVGSNLFDPLTPGAARPPIYKLPEGISQQQFDAFASQVAAGEVPSTAVEAVFRVMVKANPELNNIKNVPKKDIINYASGHMPVEEMEEVHKRMSSDFWKSDQPSTSSIKEFSRKVNPLKSIDQFILEASGGLKDIIPFTKGTKAAATEANEWLTNWIKDPATQSKISKMFDPHRKYIMNE